MMLRTFPITRYRIPSWANGIIVLAQLAALVGCFYLAARVEGAFHIAVLALAFALLMNSVYATIHEAEHAMLFDARPLNEAVGVILALFFPAPFHLIRQGHLGHHLRNRSDDEAFDFYFEGEHPLWKRMQLYGILTGCYWLMVVLANVVVLLLPFVLDKKFFRFDRPSKAFMESLNPRYKRLIQLEALLVIVTHAAIIYLFNIPILTYAIMYFAFGFTWSAMQYVHHFGTERHVTRGARNLYLFAPVDWIWLNHNWHQTHHEHPTVPWVYLPRIGRTENPKRGFLPLAYLRMWRGPTRAAEHVENRYAGRVIR